LSDGFAPFEDDFLGDEEPSFDEIMKGVVKSPSASEGDFVSYGVFQLVGHAPKPTNERCGTFRRMMGCSRAELHNKVVFDKSKGLVNCSGKGFFRPVFHSCDKPSCPKCYECGWAVREAGNVEFRLEQAAKRLGLVEHIIVALPPKFWGLSYEGLREKCLEVLYSRGVIGGAVIFHGFRYANAEESREKSVPFGWRWAPHMHVLGFILGGYRCRGCPKCRRGCGGFVDRNYRLNEIDGCYVKVKAKRKSVFGTAWYLLHHSTIRTDKKRFHVVTWFGVCSYRALKLTKELRAEYDERHRKKCPICGSALVRHEYCGHDARVLALFRMRRGARESVKGFLDRASDWVEVGERGSGSYGCES
jgi:hypothetical protein